nr:hypothetical protein Iba_chr02aCG16850 [Ipomoea batatas]
MEFHKENHYLHSSAAQLLQTHLPWLVSYLISYCNFLENENLNSDLSDPCCVDGYSVGSIGVDFGWSLVAGGGTSGSGVGRAGGEAVGSTVLGVQKC